MTKILLVEDDKSLREIYGVRLMAEGYEIVSAGDGEEALAMAIKERPNLIVSDVMMPKISGFDMLDILRSTTETKDVKVIMMTALSSDDQRARGEALGADRYLVKSQVGIEDVVRTVHEVLGDSVSTPQSSAQAFGTPAPSAVVHTDEPTPAPVQNTPSVPDSPVEPPITPTTPEPTPAPVPEVPPMINTPPEPTQSAQPFQSPPNVLPQPTAPFSSNRPGSLGDRVIHPITEQAPSVDIGNLMTKELNDAQTPVIPPPPPASTDPVPPQTPPAAPQA